MEKLFTLLLVGIAQVFFAQTYQVISPDGRLQVTVETGGRQLSYSVALRSQPVMERCLLGLELVNGARWGQSARVLREQRQVINTVIEVPIPYKRRQIQDQAHELQLTFQGGYAVIFRAYNDGLAYRFRALHRDSLVIRHEEVLFNFAAPRKAWLPLKDCTLPSDRDCFHTSFEEVYRELPLDSVPADQQAFLPALVELSGGIKVLMTEADLISYPGLWLKGAGPNALRGFFAGYPLKEEVRGDVFTQKVVTTRADYIARTAGSRDFPWRVLVVTDDDRQLVSTDMVYKLARPLQLPSSGWLIPGKAQSEWCIDNNLFGVDFKAGYNTATYKYYIDYAAHFGLEYVNFDAGWSAIDDLFAFTNAMDLRWLWRYAREKGVNIFLWTCAETLERQMPAVLDSMQAWGAKGIMVDFMDRDDQVMVDFYERVAREAAQRQLFVDFHGAYKPTGMERAYPHLMTREGVVAFEWNKWSTILTTEYEVTVPFIRMVAGPLDYEPGNLRNAQPADFRPIGPRPYSQGTRVHQMAMFVVYESAYAKIVANPAEAYREPEVTRFMARTPTVWQEMGVLQARVGDYVLLWRQSLSGEYYLAALNDQTARELDADLSFLPPGNYQLEYYADGLNADRYAEDYRTGSQTITSGDKIAIRLAPGGGFVGRIRKL